MLHMKHMILSFNMLYLTMLWFQKDSLDTLGFRIFWTFRVGGLGVLDKIMDFGGPK